MRRLEALRLELDSRRRTVADLQGNLVICCPIGMILVAS
jgi:hypothetical protein